MLIAAERIQRIEPKKILGKRHVIRVPSTIQGVLQAAIQRHLDTERHHNVSVSHSTANLYSGHHFWGLAMRSLKLL